ncbi:hypothetical protein DFJ58DRAFT_751930 [Suillus subalutaceus]|uniref:uncharacterized protein n=1 Tax=Suillus subalutaceus TaxID=48586 RepID=UPI001B871169|nr:uncharacterized protein DFJ58DRAFT_751930 [Suillus subalutaceus]KAG1877598.1 hypothetical protein DFJ58DRAFT_751930 [Suillus subalutaceus]
MIALTMSAQINSTASPQSLLSNSSDLVQSSIRRNSAMGWSNTATTPLRIAKRDSSKPAFPLVARRSSSSYRHLRNNNLSSIPTPSRPSTSAHNNVPLPTPPSRRVSGEKRPRPDSMHDQAENERPFTLKRERRQSKVYQGLVEKEPVTKSPFKRPPGTREETPPPVPPKFIPVPPIPEPSASRSATPPKAITPTRPSLVTKRLHGPRTADQPSLERRRQRRKTVTWDERCDVLEFDCEEGENDPFYSDEDDYGTPDPDHPEQAAVICGSLPSELLELVDPPLTLPSHISPPAVRPDDDVLELDCEESRDDTFYSDEDDYGSPGHSEQAAKVFDSIPSALLELVGSPHNPPSPIVPPAVRQESPALRQGSPLCESASSPTLSIGGSAGRAPRTHISREDIHTRLMRKRSSDSPMTSGSMSQQDGDAQLPKQTESHGNDIADVKVEEDEEQEERVESMSVMMDISAELATLQAAERGSPSPNVMRPRGATQLISHPPANTVSSLDTTCDISNSFDLGDSMDSVQLGEVRSALDKVMQMRLTPNRSADSPSVLGGAAEQAADAKSPQQIASFIISDAETEEDQEQEKRVESMSVMTDISAELATIQTAEKCTINSAAVAVSQQGSPNPAVTRSSLDLLAPPSTNISLSVDASFELNSSLGLGPGLRDSVNSVQFSEMRSALDRLMDDVKGTASRSSSPRRPTHMRVESVTEGIKAGQFDNSFGTGDESMRTETDFDASMSMDSHVVRPRAAPLQRAATDSIVYTAPAFSSPMLAEEQASQAKHAIRQREELILEKRRAARRRDNDESLGYYTPPRAAPAGRPSRRRSQSTGDAGAPAKNDMLLDLGISDSEGDPLADSISKELKKLDPEHRKGKYRVREHEAIFASADTEQVSHMSLAGDVNGGKAWKAVRRPSDMNEYSKQIKEYRSMEKPGKAHGKVFVRVVGVRGLRVPIPQQATALTCTLNNGIHFVTTPETRLSKDSRIDQEFELIEHNKLEFTLTLKVRRDAHITAQSQALVPPPAPRVQAPIPVPKSRGGMLSFFSSSPKKQPRATPTPPPPDPPYRLPDNLARYLKQDGTLARALISFKDVAARCDTRLFETTYPLIGQRVEASGGPTTMELGEIVLQMFRLPPLPGVLSNQLPQSLEDCHRGLRHVAWHKHGGDCMTWRRRRLRVIGANLVAFNDVTKKATATINLKKAIAVEDNQDTRTGALSRARSADNYDGMFAVERSFRLIFPGNQEIFFFADTDDEKAKWLDVFRALVGHIPPNPLWAELIWQRQQEMAKQPPTQMSSSKISPR